jgi:hypothetical protein
VLSASLGAMPPQQLDFNGAGSSDTLGEPDDIDAEHEYEPDSESESESELCSDAESPEIVRPPKSRRPSLDDVTSTAIDPVIIDLTVG